jgi:phage major head subunit gpT-like protein
METRGNWTNQMPDVGLKLTEYFDQGSLLYTPGIGSVLTVRTGDGAQKNYEGMTTFGELRKTAEGDAAGTLTRSLTYLTSVAYSKYTGSIEVTQEMVEDRDFSNVFDEAMQLGRSANFSLDKSGMQLFNGGFATTIAVNGYDMTWYGDGVPTFSTVHPTKVPGGSTQSNASATGIKFGHDNLETATLAVQRQQTDNGLPITLAGKMTLVVPPSLTREAKEEMQSDLTPESAANAINVFRGTMDVVSSLFLDAVNGGSDSAWFVTIPGQDKQYHEVRKAPTMEMDKAVRTGTQVFVVSARWANWVGDWRMKWGSKGDNAAYAS